MSDALVDRDDLVEKLIDEGYEEDEARQLLGRGSFHKVDETKKIVMGRCSHHFIVDEPGETIRHVVCQLCGFGQYTNKQA